MATHLALLRGINVGGRNKLPMADLAAMFVEAGCDNVRTYIQSGNVIFDASPGVIARVPTLIAAQVAERCGYRSPVVTRTTQQLRDVVSHNPFLQPGVAEETLHVMFLLDTPSQGRVEGLDPDRSLPDAFATRDREIYLRLPNGAARTKFTNSYFDARLATTSTQRSWRTVSKLLDLMDR